MLENKEFPVQTSYHRHQYWKHNFGKEIKPAFLKEAGVSFIQRGPPTNHASLVLLSHVYFKRFSHHILSLICLFEDPLYGQSPVCPLLLSVRWISAA